MEPNIPWEERKTRPEVFLENMLNSISVVMMSANTAFIAVFLDDPENSEESKLMLQQEKH